MKKYIQVLLALMFLAVLTLLCGAALAEATIIDSGSCGANVTWKLDSAGELTISGTGKMEDYPNPSYSSLSSCAPWYSRRSSILKLTIEDGVTSIGNFAFYGCNSLTSIVMPDSVTSIGYDAFYYCSDLTSVGIGSGVMNIGENAFSYCDSLTSLTMPDGVTSIGENAFLGCYSLKEVYTPSLEAWLKISFSGYESNPMEHANALYVGGELLTNAVIPDGVTSIGDCAFHGCSSLTSISIPDSVTSIGGLAFYKCSSLKAVYISSLEAWLNIPFSSGYSNPMYCADQLYLGGELLTNAVIPDGVTSIGCEAFYNCRSLKSVSIPDSVTSIGDYAFRGCVSLTSVSIPDSVTSIGNMAFYSMEHSRITKLVFLGDDMPTMGENVFCNPPTVYCYEYSDVDYWALDNAYTTVYIDDMDFTVPMEVMLPKDCTLAVGESMQVSAATFPAQKDAQITWISSDPAVVSVENGKLTALSVGEAVITAACGSASDSMKVITYALAESFELSAAELWMVGKTSGQLSVQNILPAEAAPSFTWSSSNPSILTVSASGELLALKPGDATVTATSDNGLARECLVHVCYSVTAIEFEDAEKEVFLGSTAQLTANVTARTQNLVNQLVTFASSDPEIASVDKSVVVTGHKLGTVQITAVAESGVRAICTVQVREMNVFALPEATKEIQTEAFLNSTAECIVLPDGCEAIGSRAFAGCDKLVYIHIPDSVISIANDAFDGCSKFTIRCSEDSLAAEYALERGISIDFIS